MAKEKKTSLIKEFKAFITKGNILDMAVGVIIGGAFNAIVTALTNKILMPIVNATLCFLTKGDGLYTVLWNSEKVLHVTDTTAQAEAIADAIAAGGVVGPNGDIYSRIFYIDWSAFIEAVINFFFVALTLFIIIKVFTTLAKKRRDMEEAIKARAEAKKAPAEEEAPAEEAAPAPVEAAPAPAEDDEMLKVLKEIRDAMKNQEVKADVKESE